MIQFKPVARTSEIKVVSGAVVVGRILTVNGQRGYRQECGSTVTAPDLLRILRQMGVAVPVGAETKIETAVQQQQAVQSSARALRLGKQVSVAPAPMPGRVKRKYVRKAVLVRKATAADTQGRSQGSHLARVACTAPAKPKRKYVRKA